MCVCVTGAALLAWVIGGVLVLTASLCYAELGAMLPSAGGKSQSLYSTCH